MLSIETKNRRQFIENSFQIPIFSGWRAMSVAASMVNSFMSSSREALSKKSISYDFFQAKGFTLFPFIIYNIYMLFLYAYTCFIKRSQYRISDALFYQNFFSPCTGGDFFTKISTISQANIYKR
jgi:hypothetical protein